MLDMLLKQMLPPGFDLHATIGQVTAAIQTTVATVQRIEQSQKDIMSSLDAIRARLDATVHPSMTESNDDHQQHAGTAGNPASDTPGRPASIGDGADRAD